MRLLALTAWCLGALTCSGCASDVDAADDDGEHADDVVAGARLPARHAVDSYRVASLESRTVATPLSPLLPASMPTTTIAAGSILTVLRTLSFDGVDARLVVDATSNRSYVVRAGDLVERTTASSKLGAFGDALRQAGVSDTTLERARLTGPADRTRIALTVDMCQSSRPWERAFFEWLAATSDELGAPIDVGIAMTGLWANNHPAEFKQLVAWQDARKLRITWIDHSYTHPLNCSDAAQRHCAFLTASSVDMHAQVVDTEQLLLSQGLVPSALFRFPGLIHDHATRAELNAMSLFALDADAWLAKGQRIHDGAVVLVHGNGNEPGGIRLFLNAMNDDHWRDGLRTGTKAFVSALTTIAPP